MKSGVSPSLMKRCNGKGRLLATSESDKGKAAGAADGVKADEMGCIQMCNSIQFVATAVTPSDSFLHIKGQNDIRFQTIDEFIRTHHKIGEKKLLRSSVEYRGETKTYEAWLDDHIKFSENLKLLSFSPPNFIISETIRIAAYFARKASDCLQNARFYMLKSNLILDLDCNINWNNGYGAQFYLRCINFGTAVTWLSNCYDHILQILYWRFTLFTSAKDKDGNKYDPSWTTPKIAIFCDYNFVVKELKERNELDTRKMITKCMGKLETIRQWSNYIKHKGGVDYLFAEPEPLFCSYFIPEAHGNQVKLPLTDSNESFPVPQESFRLDDIKSPFQLDIDKEMHQLQAAYQLLYECLCKTISLANFEANSVQFKGVSDGQT